MKPELCVGRQQGQGCSEGDSEPGAEGDRACLGGNNVLIRGMPHNTQKTQARQVNSSDHQSRLRSNRKAKPIGQDQQGYMARCSCGCNTAQARTKHKKCSLNASPKRRWQCGRHLDSSSFLLNGCKASRH